MRICLRSSCAPALSRRFGPAAAPPGTGCRLPASFWDRGGRAGGTDPPSAGHPWHWRRSGPNDPALRRSGTRPLIALSIFFRPDRRSGRFRQAFPTAHAGAVSWIFEAAPYPGWLYLILPDWGRQRRGRRIRTRNTTPAECTMKGTGCFYESSCFCLLAVVLCPCRSGEEVFCAAAPVPSRVPTGKRKNKEGCP